MCSPSTGPVGCRTRAPRSGSRRSGTAGSSDWQVVLEEGEHWLRECAPPFWRAAGVAPLPAERALRRTDRELSVAGARPTSVFKLVGASQVGPGSIRGMPFLRRARAAGFRIWPFDDAVPPLAVEIWPRVLTGAVVKSRRAGRVAYLERELPELEEPLRGVAASNDDVFDAAVSAAAMARNLDDLLARRAEPEYALEGKIWRPRSRLDSGL